MSLLLIDANGLLHRAYHSAPEQYRSDGLPTNAIGKFLDLVWWVLGQVGKPQMATHGAAVFDARGDNWRHEILPSYKSGRTHNPAIPPQLRLCRAIVPTLGLKSVQLRGYEADDLLATYARLAEEAGMAVVIVSADKDLLQLVRPGVSVFNPMHKNDDGQSYGKMLGEDDVVAKFGVHPWQVPHAQALSGDAIDGISGIPGIGEKGAAELIGRFGDLETLLCRSDEISKPGLRAKVQAGALLARQSFRLASLDDQAPVPLDLDELALSPIDAPALLSALRALEIVQFARRFAYPFGLRADDAEPCPRIADLADEQMEILAA